MKKHSYFLLIGIIFGALTFYLGDKILLPYNSSGLLNLTSVLIMGIFVDVTILCIFTFLHISVDKLLRGDKHKDSTAIRRAILLTMLLDFLAFLKIFGLWSILNLILAVGIVIFIELLFIPLEEKIHENTKFQR